MKFGVLAGIWRGSHKGARFLIFMVSLLGAVVATRDDAFAESAGCALLRGGDFSFPNVNGGPFSRTETYTVEAGETITITWVNITSLTLSIGGTVVVNVPPPATGSTTYTVPSDGPSRLLKKSLAAGL